VAGRASGGAEPVPAGVSAFVYDPELKTYVPNPSPRPKSKVR
jgi:hypothetical protein